jgi:prepilin-type N-terminal cleavage/methylation domain-containing protein
MAHGAWRGDPPRTRAARRAGLTLVEVILAVVILGVALTVLLTASARCVAVMKVAKNYQTAQWTMDLGDLEHPLLTNDIEQVEVEPKEYPNGFTYARTFEEDDDEDGLYVVRTKVTWSETRGAMSHEVVRYLLRLDEKKKK